jgi:hypothetical protein
MPVCWVEKIEAAQYSLRARPDVGRDGKSEGF